MRPIDADAIEYTHAIARSLDDGHNWNEMCVTADEIADMPTLDTQEALEKQMPQTPDVWGDGYADGSPVYDSWDCPRCGWTYELDTEQYDYCPHCGQRIRWAEVK